MKGLRSLDTLTPDDPDWDRAEQMAEFGCEIFVAKDFVENQSRPSFRKSYLDVVVAFHFQSVDKGSILIIHDALLFEIQKRDEIHFNQAHWTPDQDKVKGRALFDASTPSKNGMSLNFEEFVDMINSARDYYSSVLNADPNVKLLLSKLDVSGAFRKSPIRPTDVRLMATKLLGGYTQFQLTGGFGWGGFPSY